MEKIDKKKIVIAIWIIALALILVFILEKNNKNNTKTEETKYTLVSDYSRFFTIENCVNRYLNYLTTKNSDNLIKILSEKYKTNNNITKTNVLTKLDNLAGGMYTFEAKKVLYETSGSQIKYYVFGNLYEQNMDEKVFIKNYYVIVYTDKNNSIFSITPYDGKIFKEDNK